MERVTRNGECISIDYERIESDGHRPGTLYLFKVKDAAHNRGERLIQLYASQKFGLSPDAFEFKIQYDIGINAIRRAIDSGQFSFDMPYDKHQYKELKLQNLDFSDQPKAVAPEIMQFLLHKAYWLGYKLNPNIHIYPVIADDSVDLEYLGIESSDMSRIVWRLTGRGLFDKKDKNLNRPRVTEKLVSLYESGHSLKLPEEFVFPKGTQLEAYRAIRQILQSAQREVFVVDNYLADDILDTVASLPVTLKVRLLTSKVEPDFKVAVNRFREQYPQHQLEVRKQKAEIHDRVIAIDGTQIYALGQSVRNIGAKLSFINKLEDSNAIQRVRNTLEQVWSKATLVKRQNRPDQRILCRCAFEL